MKYVFSCASIFLFYQSAFSSIYLCNDSSLVLKTQVVASNGITMKEQLVQPQQTIHVENQKGISNLVGEGTDQGKDFSAPYQVFWYRVEGGKTLYAQYSMIPIGATVMANSSASSSFSYRDKIEQEIVENLFCLGEKTPLRDACEYVLTNEAKRFRPSIVLMVAEALGKGLNVSNAALSVEFFHIASLIADDLPYNEKEKMGKYSLRETCNESIALLSSYVLITAAFERILGNTAVMRESGQFSDAATDEICRLALEVAGKSSAAVGSPGEEFFDWNFQSIDTEMAKKMVYKKNVILFEMAFTMGWLFGGGDLALLEKAKKTGYHFGMAFQVANDLGGRILDEKKQRDMDMARLIGKEKAQIFFQEEMALFETYLKELQISTPAFQSMCDMLYQQGSI